MRITAIYLDSGDRINIPSDTIVNDVFGNCGARNNRVLLIKNSELEKSKKFVATNATKNTTPSKRRQLPYQFVELLEEAEAKKDNLLEKE